MGDWFAKCGSNCGHCPAYKGNNKTAEDRQRCSDGWHKYLGVRLNPDRCYCDGCQTPDDRNPTFVIGKRGCKIRQCAVFNGARTCAHCSAYPCEAVRAQFSFDSESRDRFAARLGAPIPDDEYLTFIETYELHKHLEAIRASLAPADIVAMTPVAVKPRVVGLPAGLPFSPEETAAFAALHRVLAEVGAADGIPHVQQAALTERRQRLLKLLWAFGRLGQREEEGGPHLVLDGATYLARKIQSSYDEVIGYCETLGEHGVRCEHIPLAKKGWKTARGTLRKGDWHMTLAFDDAAGGDAALEALRTYTARLDEKHGDKAFRYFARADMQVLSSSPS